MLKNDLIVTKFVLVPPSTPLYLAVRLSTWQQYGGAPFPSSFSQEGGRVQVPVALYPRAPKANVN